MSNSEQGEHLVVDQTSDKIKQLLDAVSQATTGEMVSELAHKTVKITEVADQIIQPETIELLTTLVEVSKSLQQTLVEIKQLEENGVLTTLAQLAELINGMKQAMTSSMVSDMFEKSIKMIEVADVMLQNGSINMAEGVVNAFNKAQLDRKGKDPLTAMQLSRSMFDRETREGLSLLLFFLKSLSTELK
ncbi:hypothetical protein [Cytobacillus sp. IB215316]|uniref:hypothetical protein n=1 Tax=Cytobacillus sp. IB215316 TaxID=3097354 RepID=UPI002A0E7F80|nr:hypothetical protein [Cytobacillus sp. IB215316]MDX8362587.1 hypothetical protein [Cytobacillus sp. IB215316]